jgi:hypothetical protein
MITSRRTFVLGSASALAVAGCSNASSIPLLGRELVPARSIEVIYVRTSALSPITHFTKSVEKRYPKGSQVFLSGMYLVQHGPNYAAFPQSSVLSRDATKLYVFNPVAKTTTALPRTAAITLVADAAETIIRPNQLMSADLQQQVQAGTARRAQTIQEDDCGDCYNPDLFPNTGDNWGAITSSNNQCTQGGENIGVSYTVPSGYNGNVTVTICVYNGTTNVCFYFNDQAPGSSHNVSMWVAGNGPPSMSMGTVTANGNVNDGVGSASLPGC